jgi:hypothetical protein
VRYIIGTCFIDGEWSREQPFSYGREEGAFLEKIVTVKFY